MLVALVLPFGVVELVVVATPDVLTVEEVTFTPLIEVVPPVVFVTAFGKGMAPVLAKVGVIFPEEAVAIRPELEGVMAVVRPDEVAAPLEDELEATTPLVLLLELLEVVLLPIEGAVESSVFTVGSLPGGATLGLTEPLEEELEVVPDVELEVAPEDELELLEELEPEEELELLEELEPEDELELLDELDEELLEDVVEELITELSKTEFKLKFNKYLL